VTNGRLYEHEECLNWLILPLFTPSLKGGGILVSSRENKQQKMVGGGIFFV
jgi:hypothetical protein